MAFDLTAVPEPLRAMLERASRRWRAGRRAGAENRAQLM